VGLGGLDLLCPVSFVVGIASSTKLDFGIRRLSWASRGGGGGGVVAMWGLSEVGRAFFCCNPEENAACLS
jgi:hypothetical protein